MSCKQIDNAELERLEKLIQTNQKEVYRALLRHDTKLAELSLKFGGQIQQAMTEYLRYINEKGELSGIITDALLNDLAVLENKTAGFLNVMEYGAAGNGFTDDTKAIQRAIDDANKHGRAVHIPKGEYLISAPISLNGCSLIGEAGNIFSGEGTVFRCMTKDFTAIRQGSTNTADVMFNISDIIVVGAAIGFEIVYAINSKYERLYAIDCGTGFKIGDPEAVGCMFCEFNNLYTQNCSIGVDSHSKTYMNNNRFNNGFLHGNSYAMKLAVDGGYGAVGNVFNNVEFRSTTGRGIQLTSCINTAFNSCYFESGANAIRCTDYCSIYLNACNYATFDPDNAFSDLNVIFTEGGGRLTINGGAVFLSDDYADKYFFGAANEAIYGNIQIQKNIERVGSATGFNFFAGSPMGTEQTLNTVTINVPANESTIFEFMYPKPFHAIPQFVSVTLRGAAGAERGLSYSLTERTATGGKISISNTSTGARSISFAIYAKSV